MPLVLVSAIFLMIAGAFALFGLKYDTRRLETQVLAQERALEKARHDIAVLEAERAHLSAPARIEMLARRLGMQPIQPHQYRALGQPQRTADASAGGR